MILISPIKACNNKFSKRLIHNKKHNLKTSYMRYTKKSVSELKNNCKHLLKRIQKLNNQILNPIKV